MSHRCHWPGCTVDVPPRLWGCKRHWMRLPLSLRRLIWATYRPGQEVDKRPSLAYLAAAERVQVWIRDNAHYAANEPAGRARPLPLDWPEQQ